MKKVLVIAGIIVVAIGVFFFVGNGPEDSSNVTKTEKFIVSNPIDLEQIASISQFRSCMGHDFSGKNIDGKRETNRSMKHYITIKDSVEKAKAFAPFDGEIGEVNVQERGSLVYIRSNENRAYSFIFFHIDLLSGFKSGSTVNAGELIGYGLVDTQAKNFDMALKSFGLRGQIFDSPFNYMSNEILAEYERRGITLENIIMTKEARDASPCNFGRGSGESEQVFLK